MLASIQRAEPEYSDNPSRTTAMQKPYFQGAQGLIENPL